MFLLCEELKMIKLIKEEPIKHTLLEMAKIGITEDDIEIMVYGSEGHVPHFHFRNAKKPRQCGCIKLLSAEYFDHGIYKGRLSSIERKNLVNFLNAIVDEDLGYSSTTTNYQALCYLWNANNPLYRIRLNEINQPNYKNL
jgi:hypothetical protein